MIQINTIKTIITMDKHCEYYVKMAGHINDMVLCDVKMIFNKYDANYLKVQDFIDDNNIDECMPLSLNCADCTWVKTMFINKDKEVCVSVMECEIYEEDEVVILGKEYNMVNSLIGLLDWLIKYHNHKNITFSKIAIK